MENYYFTSPTNGDTIYPNARWEDERVMNKQIFDVDWNGYVNDILRIAAKECWSNSTYPNNGILVNYMAHTIKKLRSENGILLAEDYSVFNTGLFTEYHDPIYGYYRNDEIKFVTAYELGYDGISDLPERANYFSKPELLIFDWHYPINIQYNHILGDIKNLERLPDKIVNGKNLVTLLNGAIDTMKKRVSSNYKLAIPQYFERQNTIQLLLPLCLLEEGKPDLALVITKNQKYYQGHTCLTLDAAYNNARLIAKPESNWLTI